MTNYGAMIGRELKATSKEIKLAADGLAKAVAERVKDMKDAEAMDVIKLQGVVRTPKRLTKEAKKR